MFKFRRKIKNIIKQIILDGNVDSNMSLISSTVIASVFLVVIYLVVGKTITNYNQNEVLWFLYVGLSSFVLGVNVNYYLYYSQINDILRMRLNLISVKFGLTGFMVSVIGFMLTNFETTTSKMVVVTIIITLFNCLISSEVNVNEFKDKKN